MKKIKIFRNGKGIYYYINEEIYGGDWSTNKQHGRGVYIFKNGDKYEGEVDNGKKHGKGEYFYGNGNHYIGDWKEDMKVKLMNINNIQFSK